MGIRALALAGTLLALFAAPAAADPWRWASPVSFPGTDYPGGQTKVVATSAGEVVTASMFDNRLLVAWTTATGDLGGPLDLGSATSFALDADGAGTTTLVWHTAGELRMASRLPHATFGPPIDVVDASGVWAMDVNPDGDVAIADGSRLLVGLDGLPPQEVPLPDGGFSTLSGVQLSDAGEAVAMRWWADHDQIEPSFVELLTVPPGGSASAQRLLPPVAPAFQPVLAVGPQGRAVVAWKDDGAPAAIRASLRPAGGAFGPAEPAWTPPGATDLAVAVDGAGRAVLGFDSSYPNGLVPYSFISTAAAGDTAWTTGTVASGYLQDISAEGGDALVATDPTWTDGQGPVSASVGADGNLKEVQDVIAGCNAAVIAFDAGPQGRAGAVSWDRAEGLEDVRIHRQIAGEPSASACATRPPQPAFPEPQGVVPPPPGFVPARDWRLSGLKVRRGTKRRVFVTLRSPGERLRTVIRLKAKGRPRLEKRAEGPSPLRVTVRVPKRTWKALRRHGASVLVMAVTDTGLAASPRRRIPKG